MKNFGKLIVVATFAATLSTAAVAGETIKPLTPTKSTQTPPVGLGLGGLGGGGLGLALVGGVLTIVVLGQTSGT